MSKENNGGPAFPSYDGAVLGVTLRDYFAAKAMASNLPLCRNDPREPGESYPEYVARMSYAVADAMLAEREK